MYLYTCLLDEALMALALRANEKGWMTGWVNTFCFAEMKDSIQDCSIFIPPFSGCLGPLLMSED